MDSSLSSLTWELFDDLAIFLTYSFHSIYALLWVCLKLLLKFVASTNSKNARESLCPFYSFYHLTISYDKTLNKIGAQQFELN